MEFIQVAGSLDPFHADLTDPVVSFLTSAFCPVSPNPKQGGFTCAWGKMGRLDLVSSFLLKP